MSDAPEPYIAGQLWKLSQKRSAGDVVIASLEAGTDDDRTVAAAMSVVEARRPDRDR